MKRRWRDGPSGHEGGGRGARTDLYIAGFCILAGVYNLTSSEALWIAIGGVDLFVAGWFVGWRHYGIRSSEMIAELRDLNTLQNSLHRELRETHRAFTRYLRKHGTIKSDECVCIGPCQFPGDV